MKVTKVSASARFSKAIDDGSYKTVELGAEATLEAKESWQEAQAKLYQQLTDQLKTLWESGVQRPEEAQVNGNGHGAAPERQAEATEAHFCQEHGVPYRRYEKDGQVWYSHRTRYGWCKER